LQCRVRGHLQINAVEELVEWGPESVSDFTQNTHS
jgi:hypothetical protein